MREYAVVCPGQGAQSPDMFELVVTHPRGRAVLDTFQAELGRDLVAEARAGGDLRPNAWAQPGGLASSISRARIAATRAVVATSQAPAQLQADSSPTL